MVRWYRGWLSICENIPVFGCVHTSYAENAALPIHFRKASTPCGPSAVVVNVPGDKFCRRLVCRMKYLVNKVHVALRLPVTCLDDLLTTQLDVTLLLGELCEHELSRSLYFLRQLHCCIQCKKLVDLVGRRSASMNISSSSLFVSCV